MFFKQKAGPNHKSNHKYSKSTFNVRENSFKNQSMILINEN